MDPRRVLTFRAVAHERSFSAAARALVADAAGRVPAGRGAGDARSARGCWTASRAGWRSRARARSCSSTPTRSPSASRSPTRQLGELTTRRARLRIGAFPSALAALVPRSAARDGLRTPRCSSRRATRRAGRAGRARGELHLERRRSRTRRSPRREHEGLERRDSLREPFLVALPPGPSARARASTIALAALADEPWSAPIDRRPDRPRVPARRASSRASSRSPATRSRSASSSPAAPRSRSSRGCWRRRARRPRASRRSSDGPQPRPLRAAAARRAPPARSSRRVQALHRSSLRARMNGRLLITCPDRHGIVAAVAGFLAAFRREHHQLRPALDRPRGRRVLHADGVHTSSRAISSSLGRAFEQEVAERLDMRWRLTDAEHAPKRMAMLV